MISFWFILLHFILMVFLIWHNVFLSIYSGNFNPRQPFYLFMPNPSVKLTFFIFTRNTLAFFPFIIVTYSSSKDCFRFVCLLLAYCSLSHYKSSIARLKLEKIRTNDVTRRTILHFDASKNWSFLRAKTNPKDTVSVPTTPNPREFCDPAKG